MALSALREGDLRAAAAIAKRLLDNKPDDPAVHQLVSICDIAFLGHADSDVSPARPSNGGVEASRSGAVSGPEYPTG